MEETNKLLREIIDLLKFKDSLPIIPPYQAPTSANGEWCQACGAWKQYGTPDNHHCTGYKITCKS